MTVFFVLTAMRKPQIPHLNLIFSEEYCVPNPYVFCCIINLTNFSVEVYFLILPDVLVSVLSLLSTKCLLPVICSHLCQSMACSSSSLNIFDETLSVWVIVGTTSFTDANFIVDSLHIWVWIHSSSKHLSCDSHHGQEIVRNLLVSSYLYAL